MYEYEITYSEISKKTVGKKVLETIGDPKTIRCSRWIYKDPIATTGFKIEDLKGGTDYCNFTVRCRNEVRSRAHSRVRA